MGRAIAGMTMSVDGFVADQSGDVGRLYPDLAELRGTTYMNAAVEETGAVLMGRKTLAISRPREGLVDELRVDIMPVVLGGGLRFLENCDPKRGGWRRSACKRWGQERASASVSSVCEELLGDA